jgi:hypothetical protein
MKLTSHPEHQSRAPAPKAVRGLTALGKRFVPNVFEHTFLFREALGVRTRPRVAFREPGALQRELHFVVGDA